MTGEPMVDFELNGVQVSVGTEDGSLLDALRDQLDVRSVKDGCSPQGQCGCCTVWIDGSPRVACVTPLKRVHGRAVTTIEGLDDAEVWAEAFCAAGASQCGFCTPGIVMRLAALDPDRLRDTAAVDKSLLAHMCRCTGWISIEEACRDRVALVANPRSSNRDLRAAEWRAELEGGVAQRVHPDVALGRGGFADDLAPADALVALRRADGSWAVAESLPAARMAAQKVQGRRTTAAVTWPIDVPATPGAPWDRVLQTTWVEPAYLELDASWCVPAGEPASPMGNGGAFGAKTTTEIGAVARRLADEHGRPVRALLTREDSVRLGPKRPPMAIGVHASGRGMVWLARPDDRAAEELLEQSIVALAPDVVVEFVDVDGPPVSAALRAAGWAEVAAVLSSLRQGPDRIVAPNGATAEAKWNDDGPSPTLLVEIRCGEVLDEVVLRSYCIGAAHMALGWVRSEGLAIGDGGVPLDLTVRSFGVLRAVDTPPIEVTIVPGDDEPVNGSDAVFAAVAAAAWRRDGFAPRWPTTGASVS